MTMVPTALADMHPTAPVPSASPETPQPLHRRLMASSSDGAEKG